MATLCADIHELEEARGRVKAFVHDQLFSELQPSASGDAGDHQRTSNTCSGAAPQLSKLCLLLILKACDEMIANLRGRLAAACHKVTGLWLTDISEAREAMLHKLKSS